MRLLFLYLLLGTGYGTVLSKSINPIVTENLKTQVLLEEYGIKNSVAIFDKIQDNNKVQSVQVSDSISLLINSSLILVNDNVPGWRFSRTNESLATIKTFREEKSGIIIENMYYDGFSQRIKLPPGHYVFRSLVKVNIYQIQAYVNVSHKSVSYGFRIPAGISDEFRWVDLPFYVTCPDDQENTDVEVGFRYFGLPGGTGQGGRHTGTLQARRMDVVRLGDTSLPHRWETSFPADVLHGLETINKDPDWEQPGRVIFKDSFLGTEIWLMTQGGQTDMSYVGLPDFSNDGKYLQAGHRRPGYVVRTDGSERYRPPSMQEPDRWTWKILWPFPWEEKRIPEGSDKSDWIVTSRDNSLIKMLNLATMATHQIKMPSIAGWRIIDFPSATTHAGRGPNISNITQETIVWQSEDKKYIGLSNPEGENFRSFMIKSISLKPENDVIHPVDSKDGPVISLVGGKGGDNWRNALDRFGNRYFVFEINRDNTTDNLNNPYQVWAISLTEGDPRGLLRVVPFPGANRLHNDSREYSLNWWEFAAGFPQSGDNAIFLLEDGTYIHMSSLGVHSGFPSTIYSQCPYKNDVTFIASYPKITGSADRISWPHEFEHNRDFAILEAITDAAPYAPIVMIDLRYNAIWTLVLSNYFDYALRYWQRPQYKDRPGYIEYHKPMFRQSPTPSPDFTKVTYGSSMLTGDASDRMWGDTYIAVARYPQPPVNVRFERNHLVWNNPFYCKEIKGFNIYRSDESGKGSYAKINEKPVTSTIYKLPSKKSIKKGFYVITSVEHSGLESRNFSNEVNIGGGKIFRIFCQPEEGELISPMVPIFQPGEAANSYAVAITDPELLFKKQLEEGLEGSVKVNIELPIKGKYRILARVRGMSGTERSTYTTGWTNQGKVATGDYKVNINGKSLGKIHVDDHSWKWTELNTGKIKLSKGKNTFTFSTNVAGIAIDNILITNDSEFEPEYPDNTPVVAPSVPSGLRIEKYEAAETNESFNWRGYIIKAPYVQFAWESSTAPQGIRYYNIYRSETEEFDPSPSTLIGSTGELFFIDSNLKDNKEYHYKIIAVDNWDNRSLPSGGFSVSTR